jgi:hypothetical protein
MLRFLYRAMLCCAVLCTGPAGPQGVPGADGDDGDDGINGTDGQPGPPGKHALLIVCPAECTNLESHANFDK